MGLKEDVLALADELEAFEDGDCEECGLYGQPECKGPLSCMEIMARYAARKMREAVERDGEGATTVSAYDLLSDDDREAIAWVREHGGLGMAASRFESGEIAADMLWGKGHGRFWTTDEFEEEISKRLMPEGMEWPTVDGEPVVIGERMRSCGIEDCKVVGIDLANARLFLAFNDIEKGKAVYFPDLAKDCHRPAPKVLDADGVEICVGDRLYDTDTGCGRTVRAVNDNGTVEFDGHENRGWFGCFLTHRALILAADGEPLEVGQTVWHVGNGVEFTVIGLPRPGEYQAVELRLDDGAVTGLDPDLLTHERPVLDEDGVPIKEGDTVYLLPGEWCDRFPCLGFYGGEELNVIDLNPKHGVSGSIKCCKADKMTGLCYPQSSQLTHAKPEPPDSRQAIVNEIGDEMAARIDLLVSSGRWSDAD